MFGYLIVIFWLVLIFYWIISAKGNKKTQRVEKTATSGWLPRSILIIIFAVLWLVPIFFIKIFLPGELAKIVGLIACGVGIFFAIWARRVLGRDWSAIMEIKEGHRLITDGPYKLVRHPIYTGVISALLGSFVEDGSAKVLIILVLVALGMYARTRIEERLMAIQFPDEYPQYKKRTKALIPWIF